MEAYTLVCMQTDSMPLNSLCADCRSLPVIQSGPCRFCVAQPSREAFVTAYGGLRLVFVVVTTGTFSVLNSFIILLTISLLLSHHGFP